MMGEPTGTGLMGTLALDSPGDIAREILAHEDEVEGIIVFAFCGGRILNWGCTGSISSMGIMVALQLLHAEATKLNALITAPVEGNG